MAVKEAMATLHNSEAVLTLAPFYRYHWVSEFAPRSSQRYLSYMTGWLVMTGWQSAITGIGMLIATIIQGLAVLNNEDYAPQRWQATLITIAVVAFGVGFNTFLARRLPLVESTLAVIHFGGLFVVIIILYVEPIDCSFLDGIHATAHFPRSRMPREIQPHENEG